MKVKTFLFVVLFPMMLSAQEYNIKSRGYYTLTDNYPNVYWTRGAYTSPDRCDRVLTGEDLTIYAYNKKMDWVFVYNQKKMGIIVGICDEKYEGKKLIKHLKDANVSKVKYEFSDLLAKQAKIRQNIDKYYAHEADLWRIKLIKDSLEARRQAVEDSIKLTKIRYVDSVDFLNDIIPSVSIDSIHYISVGLANSDILYADSVILESVADFECKGKIIGNFDKQIIDRKYPSYTKIYTDSATICYLDSAKNYFNKMESLLVSYAKDSIYLQTLDFPTRQQLEESWAEYEEKEEEEKYDNYMELVEERAPIILCDVNGTVSDENPMQINIGIINYSTKKIKTVDITGQLKNRINEPIRELRTKGYYWKCRLIGPITPVPRTKENFHDFYDVNALLGVDVRNISYHLAQEYNNEFEYGHRFSEEIPYYWSLNRNMSYHVHITSVVITYMDGSKISLSGKELQKHIIIPII